MKLKNSVGKLSALVFISIGLMFTIVNIYGMFQDIRPVIIFEDELRFENDQPLEYQQVLNQLQRNTDESDKEFAERATRVVAEGLAHIRWLNYAPEKFNQLVPIWENYFLHFMGRYSGIPEYERYHFTDYKKSLYRGIGICGDASMVLSQVLDEQGIDNQIITFPGHVIVSAQFTDAANNAMEYTLDPDFGVILGVSPEEIKNAPYFAAKQYGYSGYQRDVRIMNHVYNNDFQRWDGVQHFVTKKYYFERVSYWLKWPLPILFILLGVFFWRKIPKSNL